jgi:hypothetical protein
MQTLDNNGEKQLLRDVVNSTRTGNLSGEKDKEG